MDDATPAKPNRKRTIAFVLAVLIALRLIAYVERADFYRAVVAFEIKRANIFMPPPRDATESNANYLLHNAGFYWDFAAFRIGRDQRLKELNPTFQPLVKEVTRRQSAGEQMQYSMHIYREIRWRLNFTPDVAATRARIEDLRDSLKHPDIQKLGTQQNPIDGSWGQPIEVWYLKLYYSVDEVAESLREHPPQYPLLFLDRINSPEKLNAHLDSVLHNDITQTGIFNREELDETFFALARILFGHKQIGYAFDPQRKESLRTFVLRWQNPAAGCWGQWLVDRQGRIWKMDDMAMTFHVASDLHGDVPHLDQIARRVLQLDNVNFPAGIRFNGHYENHLNWDVVKILRAAWPTLDEPTRPQARAEISTMLTWCLTNSYQPDGSFKVSDLDDTLGDTYYYGVSFLTDAGYFTYQNRFWTDQDFPNGPTVRDKIAAKIQSIGAADPNLKESAEVLQNARQHP